MHGILAALTKGLAGPLDLLSGGAFARATEASYQTGAAVVAWAPPGARRVEDRGDGRGPMLLLEGARTNRFRWSGHVANVAWNPIGAPTRTANSDVAPDSSLCDRVQDDNVGYEIVYQSPASAVPNSISAWILPVAGPDAPGLYIFDGAADTYPLATSAPVWQRIGAPRPGFGNGGGSPGGAATTGQGTAAYWCLQIEDGAFVSSAIRTTTAALARAAETLAYGGGAYSARLLGPGGVVTLAPVCSSAELVAGGADMALLGVGTTDYLALRVSGGSALVRLVQGGVERVVSAPLTWSAGQLITVTYAPAAGALTIAGATTGNGTTSGAGAAWAPGTLNVGTLSDGSLPAFVRLGGVVAL